MQLPIAFLHLEFSRLDFDGHRDFQLQVPDTIRTPSLKGRRRSELPVGVQGEENG
jgi:hypothetical protein